MLGSAALGAADRREADATAAIDTMRDRSAPAGFSLGFGSCRESVVAIAAQAAPQGLNSIITGFKPENLEWLGHRSAMKTSCNAWRQSASRACRWIPATDVQPERSPLSLSFCNAFPTTETMMSSNLKLAVEELNAQLSKLSVRDQGFAKSLCDQWQRRGLSMKQAEWVERLLERIENPEPAPAAVQVGSLQPIVTMLETAKRHLKHPAILVRVGDRDLRLNIAGPSAKVPGSINVCSAGSYGERDWFGRVTRDGAFEPCRKLDQATQTAIAAALTALAADPAGAAAAYGHLTGVCCFCGTALTDGRSTAVGYGPVCAKHYGLAWGARAAA